MDTNMQNEFELERYKILLVIISHIDLMMQYCQSSLSLKGMDIKYTKWREQ